MFTIAGRTFTLRSRRPATWFTPVAVLLLVLVANGTAINWQRDPGDFYWYLDVPLLVVAILAAADCLERLASMPREAAAWVRLVTFMVSTLMLSSAFIGPFTLGIARWAAVVIGLPWAVMVCLTFRELIRLVRRRSTATNLDATVSASL